MRFAIAILSLMIGAASAAQIFNDQLFNDDQPEDSKVVPILDLKRTDDHRGQFSYGYKSADGTTVEERGVLKHIPEKKDYVLVKSGRYFYYDDNNKLVETKWTADENGFHPDGEHLPNSQ